MSGFRENAEQAKRLDRDHANANLDSFDIFYSGHLCLIHGGDYISMRISTLCRDSFSPSIALIRI